MNIDSEAMLNLMRQEPMRMAFTMEFHIPVFLDWLLCAIGMPEDMRMWRQYAKKARFARMYGSRGGA